MDIRGQAEGPFQLFIGIIIFGMALVIGAYLFDSVNCWKCNEMLKIQASNLREALTSIGSGDINSRTSMLVEVEGVGSCAKGIYIRKVDSSKGNLNCRSTCPNHPNSCWVVFSESRCGEESIDPTCVDISGDTRIEVDPDIIFTLPGDPTSGAQTWKTSAYAIQSNKNIQIEKTDPSTIYIGKPGSSL